MIRTATALMRRHSHINWALADQTVASGVNFFTGILLARYLGIEEFGRFTLLWMAVLFVNSIQHAMINSPMMSIGPKQPETEAPAYYGAIIIQQTVFSCVVFLLLFGGVKFSGVVFPEWGVEGLALPLATAAFATQFQDFLRRYFFTRGRASTAFANDAIRYVGQIIILVWLFMSFRDAMDSARVLWVIAIMATVATVCGAFFIERVEVNAAILRASISRHWHFSKWLGTSALLHWMTGNLFIMVAGGLLGVSAVGALRAAQNLMGLVHILFLGLENIVPIRAARYFHDHGKKALLEYLKRVALYGFGATAFISIFAAIAPEFWLSLVFGDQYSGYGNLLRWWAIYYVVISTGIPLTSGLRAIEQSRIIFLSASWMVLFSVVTAYPLTKYFGLTGVMGGITAESTIQMLILWLSLKKRLV